MPVPLRVLIVEDNPHDAELVVRELRRAGFEPDWRVVDTEPAYLENLSGDLDLILSDYALPEFNGLKALDLLSQRGLAVPFIIVSATIGEDVAVGAMKQGAADYLIKDRLSRLGPAVEHALGEARLRRERGAALAAQHESEQLAHAALNSLSAHIAVLNVTGTILTVNNAWRAFAVENDGATQAVGEGANYLTACDSVADSEQGVARAVAGAIRDVLAGRRDEFELEYPCHSPTEQRWFVVRVTRFAVDGSPRVVVAHENITGRKQQEQALRESEGRFRQVVESIQEVFWMSDVAKERVLYISPGFEAIWGRSCAALYVSMNVWVESLHEDDRDRVVEAARCKQALGTYDETYRIVRPDGSIRWIHDKAFPVRDLRGDVTRVVGVAEDVTQRKDLEEQFLRAQRLEAIGTLAGGIAHDLNNILAPMLMVAPLLKEKMPDARDLELLSMVEKGAQRGANIIKQLLTFSRGVAGERGPVQVRHLLKDMVSIMHETFPREITVEERLPGELWPVTADATQIHQVLLNLCVNARDAMRQGGTLRVAAQNVTLGAGDTGLHPAAKPGAHVRIEVSDTGEGIPPANLARIFEPFFTTKAVGKGTGLGLSTVLGIVKSHGGFVTVDSEPGRGTMFMVYLPADAGAVAVEPAGRASLKRGAQELILVVDDEVAIRHALRVSLEASNYRVILATDGRQAASLYLEHRESVRLVLTDIMMPGMSGVALIRALRALSPELRVVAMSGLHDQARHDELVELRVQQIVAKPYSQTEILDAVHGALTGA
ncbi:MAG: response regulator [Verrucomicrobia bacterium]|nr:response regulator [Verrucomicrobiota bacterium]